MLSKACEIQIWCLLNDEGVPTREKPKGGTKRSGAIEKSSQPKKPRGRPIKKPIEESIDNLDGRTNTVEVLAIGYTEDSSELHSMDCVPSNTQGNDVQEDNDKMKLSYRQTQPKKPRGRPKKKPVEEPIDNLDGGSNNDCEVLTIEYQKESLELHYTNGILANTQGDAVQEEQSYNQTRSKRPRAINGKKPIEESVENLDGSSNTSEALHDQYHKNLLKMDGMDCATESPEDEVQDVSGKKRRRYRNTGRKNSTGKQNLHGSSHHVEALAVQCLKETSELHYMDCVPAFTQAHGVQEALNEKQESSEQGRCSVPKDVALPRTVFCLAHHGKVAWDVKWRPLNEHDSGCKHRMDKLNLLNPCLWHVCFFGNVQDNISSYYDKFRTISP